MVGDGTERAQLQAMRDGAGSPISSCSTNCRRPTCPPYGGRPTPPGPAAAADTFKIVLPSKMFEAMALRRPIVLGVEGEARP